MTSSTQHSRLAGLWRGACALLGGLILAASAQAQTWTKVADEGGSFTVAGTQTVRFGAGSNWIEMSASGTVQCNGGFFGGDPIYGVFKECDVLDAAPTNGLANGSFETPAVGEGNYSYGTTGGTWVFANAGITGNGSAFTSGSPNAPDGAQAAFIQYGGTATQTLTLSAGTYTVSFQAVQRAGYSGTQILQVSIDGTALGTFQPPTGAYGASPAYSFTVTTGTHTLQLSGVGSGSDYTAFVDNVQISQAQSPPPVQSCAGPANPSFETPSVGTGPSAYSYGTSGATWVFDTAGITGNASEFTSSSPNAPGGAQAAFIQYGGTATQSLTLAAGTYTLSFKGVQRGVGYNSGVQIVQALVDGTAVGSFQPPSAAYGQSPNYAFTVSAGTHTLQLRGTGSGNDYTAFVDEVCIKPQSGGVALPPPPASPTPVVNYEYDAQGNPTKTVQAPGTSGFNFATTNTYDALNRPKDSTDAKAGVTRFGYDGLDRTVQVTDPRSLVTQIPRNGLGDATSLVSPDTGTATHTFDAAGNLKTRIDSRGVLATYGYDALNRLTSVVYSQSGQTSLTYGWAYDQSGAGFSNGVGRLTSTTHPAGSSQLAYDAQGRVLAETQRVNAASGANSAQVTTTVGYGYDAAGNLTRIIYPSGRVVAVAYTGGKPSAMTLAKDGASTAAPLIDGVQWEPFGGVTGWNWQLDSGVQANNRVYDSSGRLVRYQLGTTVRDLTYDAGDRITAYTHYDATSAAATPALDQGFGYDELGRLTSITTATANWSIGYDANGNRTGVTLNSTTSTYTTETTSNRLSAITNPARSFGYDNAGNTTSDSTSYSGTYNLAGRLTTLAKAGTTAVYTLDGMGRRVRKFTSAGSASTVIFVYDQQGQLLGEYDSAGNAIREYVWLGSTPVAIFMPDQSNAANPPKVFYVHTDHLNTPRVVVDKNNALRWRWMAEPFGTTAPEDNPASLGAFTQNLRFPGQYADSESGLNYNWNRDYDASIGRYAQSDQIGLAGGINTYAYVGGNPLSRIDPMGLMGQGSGAGSSGPRGGSSCTCSETQYSIGVGGSIGGSPILVPAGFVGGGLGVGFTSNGALFVQGQATVSVGAGIFGGIGVQGGVSYANAATPAGMSVSQSAQADFNFGAGATVGASAQWTPGTGGGGSTGMPGMGRFGVGYGLQASVGLTQSVTIATPPLFGRPGGCP